MHISIAASSISRKCVHLQQYTSVKTTMRRLISNTLIFNRISHLKISAVDVCLPPQTTSCTFHTTPSPPSRRLIFPRQTKWVKNLAEYLILHHITRHFVFICPEYMERGITCAIVYSMRQTDRHTHTHVCGVFATFWLRPYLQFIKSCWCVLVVAIHFKRQNVWMLLPNEDMKDIWSRICTLLKPH